MKYDCKKVMDYVHETNRMCEFYKQECAVCPLGEYSCFSTSTTIKTISILQAWSDSHPEETNLEYFKRVFPNAAMGYDGFSDDGATAIVCAKFLGLVDVSRCPSSTCADCWNQPYNPPKEKTSQKV